MSAFAQTNILNENWSPYADSVYRYIVNSGYNVEKGWSWYPPYDTENCFVLPEKRGQICAYLKDSVERFLSVYDKVSDINILLFVDEKRDYEGNAYEEQYFPYVPEDKKRKLIAKTEEYLKFFLKEKPHPAVLFSESDKISKRLNQVIKSIPGPKGEKGNGFDGLLKKDSLNGEIYLTYFKQLPWSNTPTVEYTYVFKVDRPWDYGGERLYYKNRAWIVYDKGSFKNFLSKAEKVK